MALTRFPPKLQPSLTYSLETVPDGDPVTLGLLLSGAEDVKGKAGRIGAMIPPNGINSSINSIIMQIFS